MIASSIEKLFDACSRVSDTFSPPGREFSESELIVAEAAREKDFILIINHLSTMARLLISGKPSINYYDGSYGSLDPEESGMDIITPFFLRRRNNGPFELVYVINRFFSKTVDPEPLDIYYYLRAAVRIRYSNYIRRRKKFKDPEYLKTGRNLGSYVSRSERYVRDGTFIVDSYISVDSESARPPQKRDILNLCGSFVSPGDRVPAVVDTIFDILADSLNFQDRVERDTLVTSIIALRENRSGNRTRNRDSTMDLFLKNELSEISVKVADELRAGYQWRSPFPDDTREALFKAVEDYLLDLGLKDTETMRKYLQPHLKCEKYEYSQKYKGCLQNLIKRAEATWLEKVRCIPGLLYHIKDELYAE